MKFNHHLPFVLIIFLLNAVHSIAQSDFWEGEMPVIQHYSDSLIIEIKNGDVDTIYSSRYNPLDSTLYVRTSNKSMRGYDFITKRVTKPLASTSTSYEIYRTDGGAFIENIAFFSTQFNEQGQAIGGSMHAYKRLFSEHYKQRTAGKKMFIGGLEIVPPAESIADYSDSLAYLYTTYNFYEYESNKLISFETYSDEKLTFAKYYQYDSLGRLAKRYDYSDVQDTIFHTKELRYAKNRVTSLDTNHYVDYTSQTDSLFNSNGQIRCVRRKNLRKGSEPKGWNFLKSRKVSKRRYIYDKKGHLTRSTFIYKPRGNRKLKTIYEYY